LNSISNKIYLKYLLAKTFVYPTTSKPIFSNNKINSLKILIENIFTNQKFYEYKKNYTLKVFTHNKLTHTSVNKILQQYSCDDKLYKYTNIVDKQVEQTKNIYNFIFYNLFNKDYKVTDFNSSISLVDLQTEKQPEEIEELKYRKKGHYIHSFKSHFKLIGILKSLDYNKSSKKSKSPGTRHSLFGFKLRFRQLFQKLFRFNTTYKFLQMFKFMPHLKANYKYTFDQNENSDPVDFDFDDKDPKKLTSSYFKSEHDIDFDEDGNVDFDEDTSILFLSQFLQIKVLLKIFYSFPTVAAACFFIKYGILTINKKVIKKPSQTVKLHDIIRLPIVTVMWTRHIFARSLEIKEVFANEANSVFSILNLPWIVASNTIPAFIIWRFPTYIEINDILYANYFIRIPETIGLFFQNNPYHNHKL